MSKQNTDIHQKDYSSWGKLALSLKCRNGSTCAHQINVNHINRLQDKNHMIISIGAEKDIDKIWHIFMIKILENVSLEGTCLHTIKAMYNKPTVTIFLNEEKDWSNPTEIRNETGMATIPTPFQYYAWSIADSIRQEN